MKKSRRGKLICGSDDGVEEEQLVGDLRNEVSVGETSCPPRFCVSIVSTCLRSMGHP